jgi:hypothetical protein
MLRKNRRIISELLDEGKTSVHKDALYALGYNFNFFTHIIESKDGTHVHYCFEYGYREKKDDFIELKMNTNYLDEFQ